MNENLDERVVEVIDAAAREAMARKDTVFIEMEGGLIQNVTATNPNIRVLVVDSDIEGVEQVDVVAWDGREVEAVITEHPLAERDLEWEAAVLSSLALRAEEKAE